MERCVVESTSVNSMIGPNSPTAPRGEQIGAELSSAAHRLSRSIGISVPIAVVANADPV